MKLQHGAFRGELPILDARLLPENNAQVARNLYLRRGTLKPERAPAAVASLPGVTSPANLYHYDVGNDGDGFWFSWSSAYDVDVARSPIAGDEHARVYWTGQGAPKMSSLSMATSGSGPYPSAWYQLGVPAPPSAPTVAEPGDRVAPDPITNGNGDVVEEIAYPPRTALETAYVVTCVTAFGEEGPPSDPSGFILRWNSGAEIPAGGSVEVGLPPIPSGNLDIVAKRLYRVESGGQYQLVAELPASAISYTDSVNSDALGRTLQSLDWDMPSPALRGLVQMPNGILAGFFENTVAFCEAYRPHAWPVGYQLAFDDPVVGVAVVSGGLVVVTTGQPWLVTGSSPAAMAAMKLDVNQPCAAKRSLVDMGGYALYASPDGLVAAGGDGARVVTREVFSREQWQAINPASIHAYRYDGRYLAFSDGGCFAFTPGEGVEFFDIDASAGHYDVTRDTLYLVQGNGVSAWGEGAAMTYRWRSRLHEVPPGAAGFSCAKVIARDYPVTLRLIADGEKVLEHEVLDAGMFRLPAGFALSRDWEIEIEGSQEVHSVQVATSPGELV
ncbi:hypothetical protein HPA02_08420 [Bisbaumannia pacifica]|uniref:Uncharacterized protein n=1 Tax=Bisbaumannia pacifica TaxID=77098 RepID=A0A510X581_9GAMM|nr:hypothetical protein [Halomonas pacifica]GEK46559.1 hypothetical protein HPA02_08420 [Halomonas pacifica]